MDTLPDISFISSDELSSLSFTSDEENQLPKCENKTFDLTPACPNRCAQSETFLIKSSDSSTFEDKTITYVNNPVLADQASVRVNSHLTNSHLTSSHFNQTIVNNQTYPVQPPTLSNLNIIHNQQSQYTTSERFYTANSLPAAHLDSGLKLTNDLLDSNNNQYFNQASRSKHLIASTPLLDKSNDHRSPITGHHPHHNHQLQCTLFSPIKGDDHQPANHLTFKSSVLNEDSLLNCLEDIENTDSFLYTTLTGSDDLDLIL